MTFPIEAAIFLVLDQAAEGRSVTPEAVARTIDPKDWRRRLAEVRSASMRLAREGRLVITRHGKPVDPDGFKGVYRLKRSPMAPDTPNETSE